MRMGAAYPETRTKLTFTFNQRTVIKLICALPYKKLEIFFLAAEYLKVMKFQIYVFFMQSEYPHCVYSSQWLKDVSLEEE